LNDLCFIYSKLNLNLKDEYSIKTGTK